MFRYSNRIAVIFLVCAATLVCWSAAGLEPGQFEYEEITIENGLRVITLEDFSCPIVTVDLWYHVGSKDEDPERQGFAHMFEHMMFRGTDRLGPTDHFDYTRQIGGNCNGYTSFDQTVYVQTVPANQLELVLWLEAERMSFLKIDQTAFDTERNVVEEERRLGLNAPYGTLFEEAVAEIFKVHPYRWTPIGKIPHLRASSVPELRAFWTKYYGPNNATLIIAGAVKHAEAQALAEKYFGWIPAAPQDPTRVTVREPLPDAPRDVTIEQDNAPAPLVGIAYRTVPLAHEDCIPIELLSTILCGGSSSRAYRELVGKKELAVGVNSMDFSLEQDGVFGIGAALTPFGGKPDETLALLRKEIDKLRKKKVKPRELEKAKNQMLRGLVTENLHVSAKARVLGRAAVLEGDVSRVNRRLGDIRKITADDLRRVARQYLDPQRALTFRVERNLLGAFQKKTHPEDEAPITGEPETDAPPPGRPGATRPADYPETPPMKGLLDFDPTEQYEERALDNGLRVVVVENHEVPFVSMRLGFQAGAWTEAKPGVASMAMSMLRDGTKKHSESKLSEELERYAISLNGSADMDNSSVNASCLTEQTERAIDLMAEIVRMPKFPKKQFEISRKQILTDMAVSNATPQYLASRELRRRLYGEHPYARSVQGEIEDVKALTTADLRDWWATFLRPDMASLYFSGDINLDRAVQLAEDAFGSWKAKGPKPEVDVPPVPESTPTHIYIVDKGGDQSQIRIAQRGITRSHPGYFTSRVVSSYFGGAFSSRLNETLRVKKGLTYGAGGGYYAQRMAGTFSLSTFTKIDTTPEAVQTAIDEIKRLQDEPPNAKELDNTKAYFVGSFAGGRETPQSVAGDLWLIESQGLPEDYFRRLLDGVQAADQDTCAELAKETLDPSELVIVVVGPAKDLKEGLEAIAPVTVVALKDAKPAEDKDK